jgi:hypothetical protein
MPSCPHSRAGPSPSFPPTRPLYVVTRCVLLPCVCAPACALRAIVQGYFVPDPTLRYSSPLSPGESGPVALRPAWWQQYVPCDLREWQAATNEFDAVQVAKAYTPGVFNVSRLASGYFAWGSPGPTQCFAFEIPSFVDSNRPSWFRFAGHVCVPVCM